MTATTITTTRTINHFMLLPPDFTSVDAVAGAGGVGAAGLAAGSGLGAGAGSGVGAAGAGVSASGVCVGVGVVWGSMFYTFVLTYANIVSRLWLIIC